MEIRYVDYNLGNNFGTYIELNKHLKEEPELHDQILQHELEHTNIPGFTKKDLLLDIGHSKVSNWKLLKFMLKHPKSLFQFSPIYKSENTLFYDINMIIVWCVIIGVISFSISLSL